MANLGERALAIVSEINATVVINDSELMSWLWKTGNGGNRARPCPAEESFNSDIAPDI